MRFDEQGNIWIRQSWLDDTIRCSERGRLKIMKPEWDTGGDAAHAGTGSHAMIEHHLNSLVVFGDDTVLDKYDRRSIIRAAINEAIAKDGIKWNKFSTMQELVENAERCYEAWAREVLPLLVKRNLIEGALTEHKFQVVLFTLSDGRTVGIEGTIDFVPRTNELWDWKNPGRAYNPREKQRCATQATIYTLAAVLGGMDNDIEYHYPMKFHYGSMIRHPKQATVQLLTVNRTQGHADFAIERIKSYVDLALNFTLERPWPRNDDHFLCSSTWCPWWAICKGGHHIDDTIPVQISL
jgi:hypothetical protein